MRIIERLMKLVVKVHDVVELVRRFEASPAQAMRELTTLVRDGAKEAMESPGYRDLAVSGPSGPGAE